MLPDDPVTSRGLKSRWDDMRREQGRPPLTRSDLYARVRTRKFRDMCPAEMLDGERVWALGDVIEYERLASWNR
ncbi:MAG: hypothetical protein U1E29_18360 [Coriobacteriia bacterium]|nr:hypothetical protein [Coriobacteriia bacterium]